MGVIALANVQCTGREEKLQDCASTPASRICLHTDDAGVRCHMQTGMNHSSKKACVGKTALAIFVYLLYYFTEYDDCFFLIECDNGDVRLAGGSSSIRGRVEMCYEGVWGTVCSNNWDQKDANVVCRQLFNGTYSKPMSGLCLY